MKKTFLLLIAPIAGLMCFGQSQPNNIDIGLFKNGVHGSNNGSGAYIEIALKPVAGTYAPTPVGDNFVIYVIAPKTDFAASDVLNLVEKNNALYGSGTMIPQAPFDIGDSYIYFPIVLNAPFGLNLNTMTTTGTWNFAITISFTPAKTAAQFNQVKIIDQTNNASITAANGGTPIFSTLRIGGVNQLTAAAFFVLPVNLLNFSGYKNGGKNTLRWTVTSEVNNRGFDVQRSTDGRNYTSIGFVNSQASGGFSNAEVNYTFDDNSPVAVKKQYYRLNQVDIDGRSKLSNIVMITGEKPNTLGIGGLFPNPASTVVNVIIDAPGRDNVTLVITDMSGKTVKQQLASVETGSNTVPMDIAKLASGSYLVKVLCKSSDCETAVAKFNKQ